ncbi:hypothetical protein SAMN04488522_102470 [Pedobacter caeni]|uniref:Fasciclin domain-containing protein n=2 Tax=Pedobacter caeni TaxID=288992 RepID=A0A1M4ZUJ6_9SPHI|nr:hypothetical protein SAMN04488522_102470 [Pedobacter caeni]
MVAKQLTEVDNQIFRKMKKIKTTYLLIVAFTMTLLVMACQKDAIIDGGLSNEKVDMTTYDFLKSHYTKRFDTTLMIIDKAGMKDLINSPGTFFVPNNFTITNYLNAKREQARKKDERLNYTLDSLFKFFTPKMLRDSMGIYFFPQRIVRGDLNATGTAFQTSVPGEKLDVSLEVVNQYTVDGVITNRPEYIYLNKILGAKDILKDGAKVDPSGDVKLKDIKGLCQTTGIITNTGVVHVLANNHIWSFKQ